MNRPGALPPGTRIADLELQRCIASSPLGFDYLAHSPGSVTPCRVVEYLPEPFAERRGMQVTVRSGAAAAFDAGRRAFQLDADRFALPRHDALMVARRLLVERGTAYVQLPWIEGQPLADELERLGMPVDPADVRGWLRAIGGALAQLHRGSVVHGGVSAGRVMRLASGHVLLGLPDSARCALAPWQPGLVDVDDPSLAPEQLLDPAARARAIGPWTDVYSLATLAHLAVASSLPPPARHRDACLSRPSLVNFAGGRWDAAMLLAIDRALSPDPASRPRTMDDFMASMGLLERRVRPRVPAPSGTDTPPSPATIEAPAPPAERRAEAEPPTPRISAWQILIVVLFAVLASAAIWAAARQRPSEMPVSVAVRSKG